MGFHEDIEEGCCGSQLGLEIPTHTQWINMFDRNI